MPIIDDHVEQIFLEDNAYLFGRGGTYYLRINLPNRKQYIRSLKVKADGSDEKKIRAIGKAKALYDEIQGRVNADLSIEKLTIPKLCELFLKDGIAGVKVNEDSGSEIARIDGGRGAWTKQNLSQFTIAVNDHILPFFSKRDIATKEIVHITQRDIDNWIRWRLENFPDEAPGTFAKRNITIRHIFKLAQRMGERFVPPQITDIPKEIRKRRRKEISEDQYIELLQHVRDITNKENVYGEKLWGRNQKYAYLFYAWLESINHTGIRPWTTLKNAIKMEHIQKGVDRDGAETLTLERYEKNHAYVAIASPYWKRSLDRLEIFYKAFGITNDREYLFVHPESDKGNKVVKGEPIINFRRQWTTAMSHLGWNEKGAPQSERVAPYGIRHRFAGRKLIEQQTPPVELAMIMGTSLAMISEIYTHYSATANYARLTKGDLQANVEVDFFHPDTGFREGAVPTNSVKHQLHYALWPDSIAAPDDPIDPAMLKEALSKIGADDLLIRMKESD